MAVVRLAMKVPSWSEALKRPTRLSFYVFELCSDVLTQHSATMDMFHLFLHLDSMARLSIGAQVHQSPLSERETGRSASQQQLVRFVAFSGRAMKVESWSEALVRRGSVSESSNCTLTCLHSLRESACRRVSFQDVPDVRNRYIQDGMR